MDKNNLSHVSTRNPIQRVANDLKSRLIHAQQSLLEAEFPSSGHLCEKALEDLKLSVKVPRQLYDQPPAHLGEMAAGALRDLFFSHLRAEGIPPETADLHALNLGQRVVLLRAFESPDAVLERIAGKVTQKVSRFPRSAEDIEVGRNPGDVIDPYILAATQTLLYRGSFTGAISLTVAHKALMIIENLVGNLHEDVLGEMRGNVRAPEPRGPNQEIIDLDTNPFPGADVVQPPTHSDEPIRFHQIKSKTGSAKGGDGKRLGEQLRQLKQYYQGEVYYDAIVGNTLRGHRSMRGVLSIAPFAIVLVGKTALQVLTRSPVGPHLLLQVYRSAFRIASKESGYDLEDRIADIVEAFKGKTQAMGVHDFLSGLVESVTTAPKREQDSRLFRGGQRRST